MEEVYNMAIQWGLRRILDRKNWEMMTPPPAVSTVGSFVTTDPQGIEKGAIYNLSASTHLYYSHQDDAWLYLPASGIAGTFGAGSCGAFTHQGPSGTATAGTTTTITTNLTLPRSLKDYQLFITEGPGAGNIRTIASNTIGANSVITVTQAFSATITTSSKYVLYTGRFWFLNAGTPGLRYWDRALSAWSAALSTTGLPSWGTDGRLIATSTPLGFYFATGTATSSSVNTLVNVSKTWTVNQWTNYIVRIISGTGAGQTRTIASNTNTTLTISVNWAVNPSSDSVYVIDGNEDYLYLIGNAAVTAYRYQINGGTTSTAGTAYGGTSNTWTTLSPAVARPTAPNVGMSGNWVFNVNDTNWTNENSILNGRRIYSFRGNGTSALNYYDIPSNSWLAADLVYGNQYESFTTGSAFDYDMNDIFIQKDTTGRLFRYNIPENRLAPLSTLIYAQSTAHVGDKMWTKVVVDGDTRIVFIYFILNNVAIMFRLMLIENDTNTTSGGWSLIEI